MLNALQINQKNYILSTFPLSNGRNFEDSRKELALSVFEFYQSTVLPVHPCKMVITTACVQIDDCFCDI